MSLAYRIAEAWLDTTYPQVKCDQFCMPVYDQFNTRIEGLYNKLPLKAKKIMKDANLFLCSGQTISQVAGVSGILGYTRPGDHVIYYNIERFVTGEEPLDEGRFDSLFYHEIGHYLVHNFGDKEKDFYFKIFGTEPKTSGEPEADGFSGYMDGVAPYHVQEFWSWWALRDI